MCLLLALCLLLLIQLFFVYCFFFNDTATTEIYTLSLHDALPISATSSAAACGLPGISRCAARRFMPRSEEHTSELQSHVNLVCRLLLEKKKQKQVPPFPFYKTHKRYEPV